MVTVRVTADPIKFKRNLKNLPAILCGKDGRFARIRNLYWGVFIREMFRRLQNSFRVRSRGEVDDTGSSWHYLKRKTVKRKSREHSRGGLYPGVKVPAAAHPRFINRDTEELFKSLAMGHLTGTWYQPRPGQIAKLSGTSLQLGTDVLHASRVDKERPIFPRELSKWIREASAIAMDAIVPYLGDLKD